MEAQASYKKQPGSLSLSQTHLIWTPAVATTSPVLTNVLTNIEALFSSPPASGKHNLKITFYKDTPALTFVFTHPVTAPTDASALKTHLAAIAASNKAALPLPPSTVSVPAAAPIPANVPAATPRAYPVPPKPKPAPKAVAPPLKDDQKDIWTDWELHKKVLVKNPQLAALHYELVQTGQLSDAEFWEGRELLLLSESTSSTQSAGRSSQLIDDRWSSKDPKGGTAASLGAGTISLTPDLIRDIFDEFPEVKRAHRENVPKKVNETQFWSRYFNSRLWERHRASVRSSKLGSAKPDGMFDIYLEAPDDEIAPRHDPGVVKNRFLDLAATEEDHTESGNARDVTMQAGKQRSSLPLMRRFNEHSEKLLKAIERTGGEEDGGPAKKRARLEDLANKDQIRYDELDLDDLHTSKPPAEIHLDLEMQDRQKYFEGRSAGEDGSGPGKRIGVEEVASIMEGMRESFKGWQPCLDEMRLEKKAAEEVMATLTASVRARVDAKSKKNDIPAVLLKKTTTVHSTINEFLRQFWQAILPPPPSSSSLSGSGGGRVGSSKTPAEKLVKVEKMVRWLETVGDKVDGLVREAEADGIKVQLALTPTMESVEKALAFYHSRGTK